MNLNLDRVKLVPLKDLLQGPIQDEEVSKGTAESLNILVDSEQEIGSPRLSNLREQTKVNRLDIGCDKQSY